MLRQAFEDFLQRMRLAKAPEFSPSAFAAAMEPAFAREGFRQEAEGPEQILVIRLDAVGDMVLSSGFLRELRRNHPDAGITLVAGPRAYPLVELCPYADEVYCFDRGDLPCHFEEHLGRMLDFCETHLWEKRFSLAVSPQWGNTGFCKRAVMLLAYLSGARQRAFYSEAIARVYLPNLSVDQSFEFAFATDTYVNSPEVIHDAERDLHLLQLMGMDVEDSSMEVWVGEEDVARAGALLGEYRNDFLVVLGIGANDCNRKYPPEQYSEAIHAISGKYPDTRFVILGGKDESRDGEWLAKHLPAGTAINFAGITSLRESAAVLSMARMYIGNITGLMHMAAAVGIPLIALYREAVDCTPRIPGIFSELTRFAPWDANAIILQPEHAIGDCAKALLYGGCAAPKAHCIKGIRPEDIVRAFDIMVQALG